jgi:hypothetical protein
MIRILGILCALLALSGCGQIEQYRCVRDRVNSNEPYLTQADRDDTEVLARQLCRQKATGKGN